LHRQATAGGDDAQAVVAGIDRVDPRRQRIRRDVEERIDRALDDGAQQRRGGRRTDPDAIDGQAHLRPRRPQAALEFDAVADRQGDPGEPRHSGDGDSIGSAEDDRRIGDPAAAAQVLGEIGAAQAKLGARFGDRRQRLLAPIDDDAPEIELEPVDDRRAGAGDAPADEANALEAAAVEARADDPDVVRLGRADDANEGLAQRGFGARVETARTRPRTSAATTAKPARRREQDTGTGKTGKSERCGRGNSSAATTAPL